MIEPGAGGLELAALFLVIGSGFVATNLDNLLILVGLLGAAQGQRAVIMMGYVASAACLLVIALLGGLLGSLIDPSHVGYLGIIPLLLGGWLLYQAVTGSGGESSLDAPPPAGGTGAGVSTFVLMLSNSGDSIAVFLPLFAESTREALIVEVVAFLLMALAWTQLARLAVGSPGVTRALQRHGRYLVPVIMIGVGCYILLDTAYDTLR